MSFTQIIELEGVRDEQALQDHVTGWDSQESGSAPGYLGSRLFADGDADGRYLLEVDFSSEEEAKRNSDRKETADWASRLTELTDGAPRYRDLRQVVTTHR